MVASRLLKPKKFPEFPKCWQHVNILSLKPQKIWSFLFIPEVTKVTSTKLLLDFYFFKRKKTSLLPLPSIHFQTLLSLKKVFFRLSRESLSRVSLTPLECQTIPKVLLDRPTQVLNQRVPTPSHPWKEGEPSKKKGKVGRFLLVRAVFLLVRQVFFFTSQRWRFNDSKCIAAYWYNKVLLWSHLSQLWWTTLTNHNMFEQKPPMQSLLRKKR